MSAKELIERLVTEGKPFPGAAPPFGKKDGDDDDDKEASVKFRGKRRRKYAAVKFSKKHGSVTNEGEEWGQEDDEFVEWAIENELLFVNEEGEFEMTEKAKVYKVKKGSSLQNLKGRPGLQTTDRRKTPDEVRRAVVAGIFKMHGKRAKGGKKRESADETAASLIERVAEGEDAFQVIRETF
jgi:hypothetical protein